jgi:hypothetical protein
VRKYTFSALITPGPAACRNAAPGDLDRTRIHCVVQPRDHKYFPAVISLDGPPTAEHGVRAAVSMLLAGHEAAAFFAPGQHFTIWADAIIGHAIRGHGLAGHGVICGQESLSRRSTDGHTARRTKTGPALEQNLPATGAPGQAELTAHA